MQFWSIRQIVIFQMVTERCAFSFFKWMYGGQGEFLHSCSNEVHKVHGWFDTRNKLNTDLSTGVVSVSTVCSSHSFKLVRGIFSCSPPPTHSVVHFIYNTVHYLQYSALYTVLCASVLFVNQTISRDHEQDGVHDLFRVSSWNPVKT